MLPPCSIETHTNFLWLHGCTSLAPRLRISFPPPRDIQATLNAMRRSIIITAEFLIGCGIPRLLELRVLRWYTTLHDNSSSKYFGIYQPLSHHHQPWSLRPDYADLGFFHPLNASDPAAHIITQMKMWGVNWGRGHLTLPP